MGMIYVTGLGGMLGQAVVRALEARDRLAVPKYEAYSHKTLDITNQDHLRSLEKDSTVINCAGITKDRGISDSWMVKVNSYGPILLAAQFRRLVQVSTDCVFSGDLYGIGYREGARPDPSDFYGRTKLAGEPPDLAGSQHLVVRGSFVGFGPRGLLAWLLDHEKGATVDGYTSWLWSGLYIKNFARLLVDLALDEMATGVLHIPGPPITKYELLRNMAARIRPDITVAPLMTVARDMTLRSVRADVWRRYTIPTWDEMIEELDGDYRAGAGRTL